MMRPVSKSAAGYSLVELMVVLVLTSLAAIAMYRSYMAFRVGADVHAQISEINQNLNVGMQRLARELQMAGYDPTGAADNAGFLTPNPATPLPAISVRFAADYNRDGDVLDANVAGNLFADEDVTYTWSGVIGDPLRRISQNQLCGGNPCADIIIPNVAALQFLYWNDADPPAIAATGDDTRDVEITLVVRNTNPDYSLDEAGKVFTNMQGTAVFTVPATEPARRFRYKKLCARVKARNMGLN